MGKSTITVAVLKKNCPQHAIYCCINVQMKKKTGSLQNRIFGKIGNLAKSGIIQNREFGEIGNFAKSGGAHSHSNGVLDNYS